MGRTTLPAASLASEPQKEEIEPEAERDDSKMKAGDTATDLAKQQGKEPTASKSLDSFDMEFLERGLSEVVDSLLQAERDLSEVVDSLEGTVEAGEGLKHVVDQKTVFSDDDEPVLYTGTISLTTAMVHGRGVYKNKDGHEYNGEFMQNKAHGKGTMKFAGSSYEGDFVNDGFEGHGRLKLKEGHEYIGEFVAGKRHGKGFLKYADGSSYEGDFVNGQFEGHGRLKLKEGHEYNGDFLAGKRHGKGFLKFSDGSSYKGDFVNGQFEGHGRFRHKDGREYIGEFLAGQRHGKGTYKSRDGSHCYLGDFVNTQKNKKEKSSERTVETGEDLKHGKETYKGVGSSKSYTGDFVNDCSQQPGMITGLVSRPDLNGQWVTIAKFVPQKQRYEVLFLDENFESFSVLVKPSNLILPKTTIVGLVGLSSAPRYNGRQGMITGFSQKKGRYEVQLLNLELTELLDETVRLKPDNCMPRDRPDDLLTFSPPKAKTRSPYLDMVGPPIFPSNSPDATIFPVMMQYHQRRLLTDFVDDILEVQNHGIISVDSMIKSYNSIWGEDTFLPDVMFPGGQLLCEQPKLYQKIRKIQSEMNYVNGTYSKEEYSVDKMLKLCEPFLDDGASSATATKLDKVNLAWDGMVAFEESIADELEQNGHLEFAAKRRSQVEELKKCFSLWKKEDPDFLFSFERNHDKEISIRSSFLSILGDPQDVVMMGFTRVYTKGDEDMDELVADLKSRESHAHEGGKAEYCFAVSYKHYDDDGQGFASEERVSKTTINEILWTIEHLFSVGSTYRIWMDTKLPPSNDSSVSGWIARGVMPYLAMPVLVTSGAAAFRPNSAWLRVEWLAATTGTGVITAKEDRVNFRRRVEPSDSTSDLKTKFAALALAPHSCFERCSDLDEALIRVWAYSVLTGENTGDRQVVPNKDKFVIRTPTESLDWIRQAYIEGKADMELETFESCGWAGDLSLIPGHALSADFVLVQDDGPLVSPGRWHIVRDNDTCAIYFVRASEFFRPGNIMMLVAVRLERPYFMVQNKVLHKEVTFVDREEFRSKNVEVICSTSMLHL